MSPPQGRQTVTVITQVRGRHNEYRDGARVEWMGCSVQPRHGRNTTESTDREQRSEQLWELLAPPGFRAKAEDEVEVVPGPTTDAGTPARLQLYGQVSPWPDGFGGEHHVEAVLRRRIG